MTNTSKPKKLTIILADDEQVLIVKKNAFYKLGSQHDDIVHSDALLEAHRYFWCHISQDFKEVTK